MNPRCYRHYSIMANAPCSSCGVAPKCAFYTEINPFLVMHSVRFTDVEASKHVSQSYLPSHDDHTAVKALIGAVEEFAYVSADRSTVSTRRRSGEPVAFISTYSGGLVLIDLTVHISVFKGSILRRVSMTPILDRKSKALTRAVAYPPDGARLIKRALRHISANL